MDAFKLLTSGLTKKSSNEHTVKDVIQNHPIANSPVTSPLPSSSSSSSPSSSSPVLPSSSSPPPSSSSSPLPPSSSSPPPPVEKKNERLKILKIFDFFKKKKKIRGEDGQEIEVEEDEEHHESSNTEEDIQPATKEDCLKLLRESFNGYDYNDNGTVAHEEVREAWIMCQEEWNEPCDPDRCNLEAAIFMKDMDIDCKEHVTFEDYVIYFQQLWRMTQLKSDEEK